MQIVIDLPDKYADMAKSGKYNLNGGNCALAIRDAVMNGTVLPKGHGRLIDADDLSNITVIGSDRLERIEAPTVLEADESYKTMQEMDEISERMAEADKEVEDV